MQYTDIYYNQLHVASSGETEVGRYLPSPGEGSDGVFEVLVSGRSENGDPLVIGLSCCYSKTGSSVAINGVANSVTPMIGPSLDGAGLALSVDGNEIVATYTHAGSDAVDIGIAATFRGRSV